MADTCPVVRIRVPACEGNSEGITEINADDFNPAVHQRADEAAPPRKSRKQQSAEAE